MKVPTRTGKLLPLLTLATICLLSSCHRPPSPHTRPGTYTVGLDLSGDEGLRQQFASALRDEFAGTKFEMADTGKPDTVISGRLTKDTDPRDRGLSMFRQQITSNGETKTVALCSSTYSNYEAATRDTNIFGTDSPEAARELKVLFPKAKTVYLDPAGSFQIAPPIAAAFVAALHEKGLTVTSAPDASVTDRVTLSLDKVTTTGQTMRYNLSFDGVFQGSGLSGASWLPGETQPIFPSDCPKPPPVLAYYGTDIDGIKNLAIDVKKTLQASDTLSPSR